MGSDGGERAVSTPGRQPLARACDERHTASDDSGDEPPDCCTLPKVWEPEASAEEVHEAAPRAHDASGSPCFSRPDSSTDVRIDSGTPDPSAIGCSMSRKGADTSTDVFAVAEGQLTESGYSVVDVELPALEHVAAAYYVIATAEASANLARYDGIRYGARVSDGAGMDGDVEKLVRATRSAGFGHEVKTRILTGTFVLRSGFQEQYYQRAQRVRTLVRQEVDRELGQCDLLLLPTYPVPPFSAGSADGDSLDELQQKQADLFTSIANLTGHPALAFPVDSNGGRPIGMQLMGPAHSEEQLLTVVERLAERWPPQRAAAHLSEADA